MTEKLSCGIKRQHISPLCPSASEMCAKNGRKSTHIRAVVWFLAWGRVDLQKVVGAWSRAVSDLKEGAGRELKQVRCTRERERGR